MYYIDASVLLRFLLQQQSAINIVELRGDFFSSELLPLECRRTLVRYRLIQEIDDEKYLALSEDLTQLCKRITVLKVDSEILNRAAQNWGIVLGSLDSIHLATAIRYRETHRDEWTFLTHDNALAGGARLNEFRVMGV
ncbi:MAG: type II toxin-antitoxin system VapC family toxin [Spirochaetes bacterium]|nr:type II toxin-antitoxin system VapC family toxin [Spirochaetota bacterium]